MTVYFGADAWYKSTNAKYGDPTKKHMQCPDRTCQSVFTAREWARLNEYIEFTSKGFECGTYIEPDPVSTKRKGNQPMFNPGDQHNGSGTLQKLSR